MKYTAGKAAEAAGVAKSTITKAISNGKLSAIKNNGAWEIDAAELHRVFPPKRSETVAIEQTATPAENSQEIEFLKKQLEAAQEQIDDIKKDRDAWRNQANTLLITNQGDKKKGPFGLW